MEQLSQMEKGDYSFLPPEQQPQNQDGSGKSKDTEDEDAQGEDTQPAEAAGVKMPRRIQINQLDPREQVLMVAAIDLTRKLKISMEEALVKVGLATAAKAVETKTPDAEATTDKPASQAAKAAEGDALAQATAELEAAEAAMEEAESSYDPEQIRPARRKAREALEKVTLLKVQANMAAEREQKQRDEAVDSELKAVKGAVPELADENSALAKAFRAFGEDVPDSFYQKPEPFLRLAKLAWNETYPDKPFPGGKGEKISPPRKPGAPVAALAASGGGGAKRDLAALLRNPQDMTDAELAEVTAMVG